MTRTGIALWQRSHRCVSDLALRLLDLLSRQADTARHSPSAFYQIPSGEHFPYYLLRLEHLLAVRCAGMDARGSQTLSGEREILDADFSLEPTHELSIRLIRL